MDPLGSEFAMMADQEPSAPREHRNPHSELLPNGTMRRLTSTPSRTSSYRGAAAAPGYVFHAGDDLLRVAIELLTRRSVYKQQETEPEGGEQA